MEPGKPKGLTVSHSIVIHVAWKERPPKGNHPELMRENWNAMLIAAGLRSRNSLTDYEDQENLTHQSVLKCEIFSFSVSKEIPF